MWRRVSRYVVVALTAAFVAAMSVGVPVASASRTTALPVNGSFVDYHGVVYRLVEGGLVRVYSWGPFGGPHRSTHLSSAQFDATGLVADGAFIRSLPDRHVYRVLGGAPLYVSTWSPFGGAQKYIDVDGRALDHPSLGLSPTVWDDYGNAPKFARSGQDGRIYSFLEGAPVYVHDWAAFGGPQRTVTVDGNAFLHAGQGPWHFLLPHPPDGLAVRAVYEPGSPTYIYEFMGGAPVYVPTIKNMPDWTEDSERVDARAMDAAGGAFPDSLVRARPADGTFFTAWRSFDEQHLEGRSQIYWVSGGAAIAVHDSTRCPARGSGRTDQLAVDRAGTGGVWNHLAKPTAVPPTPPC